MLRMVEKMTKCEKNATILDEEIECFIQKTVIASLQSEWKGKQQGCKLAASPLPDRYFFISYKELHRGVRYHRPHSR